VEEDPILLDVENVNYYSYEISENDRIIFTSYSICENKTIIIIVNARMAFTIHRTRMRPVPPTVIVNVKLFLTFTIIHTNF